MAGVMMVVLLNLPRRQSLVLVASEIYRLCEVCQQLGKGLKSENKIHWLQSIARLPSMGRAPSRGSTEAGEGLWLYFKVFLLHLPLPPQAARTSAEVRSAVWDPQSALSGGFCMWAISIVQSIKMSAGGLFTGLLSSQNCSYVATLYLFAQLHTFTLPTKTLCLLTASGYAGYLPHWPQSSPIPRRNCPSPPHTGDEIRFLLQAGNLSLKGCHTKTEKQIFCFFFYMALDDKPVFQIDFWHMESRYDCLWVFLAGKIAPNWTKERKEPAAANRII